jgi:hypothetical protein
MLTILGHKGNANQNHTFRVKLARLGKAKITCSPSCEDYRPKTNAVILLNMGHILRGECTWEE